MPEPDKAQDSTQSPKGNSRKEDECWGPFGFEFGLARRPTKAECIMIATYMAVFLTGCVIHKWDVIHNLLSSKTSKIAEYVGLTLILVTGGLLLRALDKKGLLREKYEPGRDDTVDW